MIPTLFLRPLLCARTASRVFLLGCWLGVVILGGVALRSAGASPWQRIGRDLDVSVSQLNAGAWTWQFRNTGHQMIAEVDYEYVDAAGRHRDTFSGLLRPGQIGGGLAEVGFATSPPRWRFVRVVHRREQ